MKTTLGIDLGTTKVAAVLLREDHTTSAVASMAHEAALSAEPGGAEQNVEKIFDCVAALLARLPAAELQNLSAIGVTGQMHSVLLGGPQGITPLITWQDHRCGEERLRRFHQRSGLSLREGFGGATLARLAEAGKLDDCTFAAPLADYLVARLTGSSRILSDPTHAASWGLYDAAAGEWNFAAAEALGIPRTLLPELRPCGSAAGNVSPEAAGRFGLKAGTPVIVAIGDNQASILSSGENPEEKLHLTLGTGAQLSLVTDNPPEQCSERIEARPFPGGRTLLVAAPLCGGAAFAWLADTVNTFRKELGEPELPRGELLDRLDALALAELRRGEPELTVTPNFLGERWNPALRGEVSGLTLTNATPGSLGAALALGIVRNLKAGFAPELIAGKREVIGSGNAVRLLKSIQWAIRHEFGLPLRLPDTREEAATGVALLAQN